MANPEQMGDFLERRLAGQLMDVVTAVNELALFAKNVAKRGRCRHHAFEPFRLWQLGLGGFGRLCHRSALLLCATRCPIDASPAPGRRSTRNDRLKAATPLRDESIAGHTPGAVPLRVSTNLRCEG